MLECLGAPNLTQDEIDALDAEQAAAPARPSRSRSAEAVEPSGSGRRLKRQKTVENLQDPYVPAAPAPPPPPTSSMDAAAASFSAAQAKPSIGNLIEAFARGVPHSGMGLTALQRVLQEMDPTGSVLQSAGVDALEPACERVATSGLLDEAVKSDLMGFVNWLHGFGFAGPQLHMTLARILCGGISPPLTAGFSAPPPQPTLQQQHQLQQRLSALGMELSHYAGFVSLTYRGGVLGTDILEGMLLVTAVRPTYLIVEDPSALGATGMPPPPANSAEDTMLPLKLRMPPHTSALVRPGDRLTLHIARLAEPAHWWAPTAFVSAHGPARGPHALQPEDYERLASSAYQRERMDRATERNDETAYNVAFQCFRRAVRGEELMALGELEGDGYDDMAAHQSHQAAQPRSMPPSDQFVTLPPHYNQPAQSHETIGLACVCGHRDRADACRW